MFFDKNRKPNPSPPWIKWLIIGVVVYAALASQNQNSRLGQSVQKATEDLNPAPLYEDYKNKIFPEFKDAHCAHGIAPSADSAFRIIDTAAGHGAPLACGQTAQLRITLWNLPGKILYESKEPLSFTLDASQVFSGLEQGTLGMRPGGKRMLVVPPELQKPSRDNAEARSFPFPKDEIVLVEVELLEVVSR